MKFFTDMHALNLVTAISIHDTDKLRSSGLNEACMGGGKEGLGGSSPSVIPYRNVIFFLHRGFYWIEAFTNQAFANIHNHDHA